MEITPYLEDLPAFGVPQKDMIRKKRSKGLFPLPMLQLARLGALAPSRQNTQPWKFSIQKDAIRIYPDFSGHLGVCDPAGQDLYASLGCAAENILVGAEHYGFQADLDDSLSSEDGSVLIRFRPGMSSLPDDDPMSGMALRQCNRRPFSRERIPGRHLQSLARAGRRPGVDFGIVTDEKQIRRVEDLVRAGQKERKLKFSEIAQLASWTRFSRSEARAKRDGVLFTDMGYPPLPRCIGVAVLLVLIRTNRQARRSAAFIRSSSALVFFAPQKESKRDWFDVGRSFQRVVLTAAAVQIRYAHLQLPYCLPVDSAQLGSCLGCDANTPLVIARLGYSDLVTHSLRRPLYRLLVNS